MTTTEAPPEAAPEATAPFIGTRMLRREDPTLLTGEARFTDDLDLPGALHMAILRSPFAHARITSIDASAAKALPGVVEVFTGAELADLWATPMPCAWPVTEDMKNPPHYPLAIDTVNYVGDGVAVVLAHSNAEARDALDAIDVDYDPLEAVVDLADALSDRVIVHDDLGTNTCYRWELHLDDDAVDRAFATAAHTVKERYVQQRLLPMFIEPRACAAVPQPFGGDITLYSSTQIPHILKVMVAITLGFPEQQLRVIAPSVGGGFGGKLNVYADELLEAGPLGRGADRERHGLDPWPRPDPGHRAGGRRRRQGHGGSRRPGGGHGRLPATRHSWDPTARRLPLLRGL